MSRTSLRRGFILWRTLALFLWIGHVVAVSGSEAAEPIRIVTIQLRPFGFLDKDTPHGIHYEFSNRIFELAGLPCTNRIIPYARVMKEFEDGTADVSIMYSNNALAQYAVQVIPVITYANIIIGRAGTQFASLEDLHGKKVAQLRGSQMDAAFTADKAIEKFDASDYEQSLRMLFSNRVDAVLGADIGIYSSLKSIGHAVNDLGIPLTLNTKDAYLHLSKKIATDEMISKLRQIVKTMQEDGTIAATKDRYMFQQ